MTLHRLLAVLFISFLACGSWAQQSPGTQGPESVAQDSLPAEYDVGKPVEFMGAVTKTAWMNPRTRIYMDVKKSDGTVANWAVEVTRPEAVKQRLGPDYPCLPAGSIIKVSGFRAKDGSLRIYGRDITFPDGTPSAGFSYGNNRNSGKEIVRKACGQQEADAAQKKLK